MDSGRYSAAARLALALQSLRGRDSRRGGAGAGRRAPLWSPIRPRSSGPTSSVGTARTGRCNRPARPRPSASARRSPPMPSSSIFPPAPSSGSTFRRRGSWPQSSSPRTLTAPSSPPPIWPPPITRSPASSPRTAPPTRGITRASWRPVRPRPTRPPTVPAAPRPRRIPSAPTGCPLAARTPSTPPRQAEQLCLAARQGAWLAGAGRQPRRRLHRRLLLPGPDSLHRQRAACRPTRPRTRARC